MVRKIRKIVLLYLAASALYAALAVILRNVPNIVIDESLYTNITRGLLAGQLTYRGQPVLYPYLLYPLALVPVYRLQALLGGDIYVWVKVFGALLICSSVFPVYLLAKDVTGEEKKAFLASALTALIPDMLMCSLEMSESLIWPLALWMMYFAWRLIRLNSVRCGVLTGLFAGLLFAAKPGAVAMGAAFHTALLILRIRKKAPLRAVLAGIGTMLGVILLVYAVYMFVFGRDFSLAGLYAKQTSDWDASHLIPVALGLIGLPLAFIMSGAGFFVLLPYLRRDRSDENRSALLFCATAGLITAMAGTAVFVVPYQWNGTVGDISLHTRYLSMYLPVWFILTLDSLSGKNLPVRSASLAAIPLLALGLKLALAPAQGSVVDTVTLGSFIHSVSLDGTVTGVIFTAALSGFMLYAGYKAKSCASSKSRSPLGKILVIGLAVSLLFNSVCAAVGLRYKAGEDIIADARQLDGWIRELPEEPLGITQRRYSDVLTYYQESRLTRPMQQITMDQAVSSMNETNGIYRPLVPVDQSPNTGNGLTPDTSYIVLGQTVGSQLELSDVAASRMTDHGIYTLVTVPEGDRWVDSMLYGIDENVLFADTESILLLFDPPAENAVLRLNVTAPSADTEMTFTQGGQTETVKVAGTRTVEIPLTSLTVYIATDKPVQIDGYRTKE